MTSTFTRLAAGPFGPTRLALVLALITLPALLIVLPAFEDAGPPDLLGRLSPLSLAVLSMMIPAVLLAALIAGSVGGWLVRRRKWLGAVATFVLAWVVAISALPLGLSFVKTADGCCSVGMGGFLISDVSSGVQAVARGWWISPLLAPGAFLVLLVGVVLWSRAIRADVRASRAAGEEPEPSIHDPGEHHWPARRGAGPGDGRPADIARVVLDLENLSNDALWRDLPGHFGVFRT